MAKRIGRSANAIKAAVRIWTGLAPQIRGRLHGTPPAARQTELKALSEVTSPEAFPTWTAT